MLHHPAEAGYIHAAGLTGRSVPQGGRRVLGLVRDVHPALQRGTLLVEDRTHPITKSPSPATRTAKISPGSSRLARAVLSAAGLRIGNHLRVEE